MEETGLPEPPDKVVLSVCGSYSLSVTFQEPKYSWNSFITKYRVDWSTEQDFSLLIGGKVLENLQELKYTITGLSEGRFYFVRVSAFNMKGWGPPGAPDPPSAAPSSWRSGVERRSLKRRSQTEALERLLQQVRATLTLANADCPRAANANANASRKPSVSRSLRNIFTSSNKFVKTMKRGVARGGVYLTTVCYHDDRLLVTSDDQLPVVEVDDQSGGCNLPDFLWFTKLSLMWDDVVWLHQTTLGSAPSGSVPSGSSLQVRLRMLTAANMMQRMLGLEDLGRVHYEPIRDRQGNTLLVTVSNTAELNVSGRWRSIAKLTSNRKSEEEPNALDILVSRLTELLAYQRASSFKPRPPGLYLGLLRLRPCLDRISLLLPNRKCNDLGSASIRLNANVSREEWEWLQSLGTEPKEEELSSAPPLFFQLKAALLTLLTDLNMSTEEGRSFLLYKQEVAELGHGVNFLLLLPASDELSAAPSAPPSGCRLLPLHEFQLVHLASYRRRYVSVCCRLAVVLQLAELITQLSERLALTVEEVGGAKRRHQQVQRHLQQLEELRGDASEPQWLTAALMAARDKLGIPVSFLLDANPELAAASDFQEEETDSAHQGAELHSSTQKGAEPLRSPAPLQKPRPLLPKPRPLLTGEGVSLPGRRRLRPQTLLSPTFSVVELRGRGQQNRPRLFLEWAEPEKQEVDSDDNSDAQMEEILSSVL